MYSIPRGRRGPNCKARGGRSAMYREVREEGRGESKRETCDTQEGIEHSTYMVNLAILFFGMYQYTVVVTWI